MTTATMTAAAADVLSALTAFADHQAELVRAGLEHAAAGDVSTAAAILQAVEAEQLAVVDGLCARRRVVDGYDGVGDQLVRLIGRMVPTLGELAEAVPADWRRSEARLP